MLDVVFVVADGVRVDGRVPVVDDDVEDDAGHDRRVEVRQALVAQRAFDLRKKKKVRTLDEVGREKVR
jgi:hypothetical protein